MLLIILVFCVVCLILFVGVRVACHFSFLCCVFCFCLWGVRVACHFSFSVLCVLFLFVGSLCCLSF